MYMVACVSAWVHPEQQFEECYVDLSLLPVVVSITQELVPLQPPSSVPWVSASAHAHHFSGNLVLMVQKKKFTITTVKLQILRDAFKVEKTICRYLV
jgi:hypothetical protein